MNRHNRGFTLQELMVVIAVVALLAALMVPWLHGTFAVARTNQCAQNVHNIAVAYTTAGGVSADGWASALLHYLGRDYGTLLCPEDEGNTDDGRREAAPPDLSEYSIYDKSTGFYMRCEEAPLTAKLSPDQLASFNPQEYSNGREPPPYIDDDSGVWWYCFEDLRTDEAGTTGGGDRDFEDVFVKCEKLHNDKIRLTSIKGGSGHQFSFCDPNRGILHDPVDRTGNQAVEILASLTPTSYGMNSQVAWTTPLSQTLLLMDYEQSVVNTGGDRPKSVIDDWTEETFVTEDGRLRFARHRGKMNVLRADTTVRLMAPWELHIETEETRELWQPGYDGAPD